MEPRATGQIAGFRPAIRLDVDPIDPIDSTRARSLPELALEAFEGFDVPLRKRFDVAARQIAHPPAQLLTHGGILNKEPESDALYATADEIPSCNTHAAGTGDYSRKCGRRHSLTSATMNSTNHTSGSA